MTEACRLPLLLLPYPPADLQHCFCDAVGIPDRAPTVSEVEELWKQDRIRLIVNKRCGERMQACYSIALPATIPTVIIPTAAIPTAATPAVVTARRRRRRPNSTAAAVPTVSVTSPTVSVTVSIVTAPTVSIIAPTVTASTVTAPTERTRTKERRTKERGSKEEAKCFGFGGNGGSSKWESCCEHDGYPA
jgi:hypothetical protein